MVNDRLGEVLELLATWLNGPCDPDERLFSTRRLDSVTLMTLVVSLHDRYGIDVEPDELSLANFDTARRVADYLDGRLDSAGRPERH